MKKLLTIKLFVAYALGISIIQQYADVDLKYGLKPDELLKEIPNYRGLIVRSGTKV